MPRVVRFLFVTGLLLFGSIGFAATAEQLALARELMRVSNANSALDAIMPQLQQVTAQVMQQSMSQYRLTKEEGAELSQVQGKIIALFTERYRALAPAIEQTYAETYSEAEMKGIIAFYSSAAGQAMLRKGPEVMKKIGPQMQDMVLSLQPRIQLLIQQEANRILAARKTKPAANVR